MAYGGLHWSPESILALTPAERLWYVERLEKQMKDEADSQK